MNAGETTRERSGGYRDDVLCAHVERLAQRGDVEQLTYMADAGNRYAANQLVLLFMRRGDVEQLVARLGADDPSAMCNWVRRLEDNGELDRLARLADAGQHYAQWRLACALAERGEIERLAARSENGDDVAHRRLLEVLDERGDLAELARRAQAGDADAADRLTVRRLVADGDLSGLRAKAAGCDVNASCALARMLADRGEFAELAVRQEDDHFVRRTVRELRDRGVDLADVPDI